MKRNIERDFEERRREVNRFRGESYFLRNKPKVESLTLKEMLIVQTIEKEMEKYIKKEETLKEQYPFIRVGYRICSVCEIPYCTNTRDDKGICGTCIMGTCKHSYKATETGWIFECENCAHTKHAKELSDFERWSFDEIQREEE